eukprot:g8628.t1
MAMLQANRPYPSSPSPYASAPSAPRVFIPVTGNQRVVSWTGPQANTVTSPVAPVPVKSPKSPGSSPVGSSPPARYIVAKVASPHVVTNAIPSPQPLLPGQSPQGRFSPVSQGSQRTYARPSTASPVAPRALWTQPQTVLNRTNSIPTGSPVAAASRVVQGSMVAPAPAKRPDPPVTINGRVFERLKEGREMGTPNKKELLEACLLEAEVLQQLARELPSDVAKRNFVPRYVTHCAVSVNGNTQVLLAMSKLDGVPLDQWLYGINEHELKVISRGLRLSTELQELG